MYKNHNNPMTILKYLQKKTIENKASLPNSENLQIVICAAFVITNREGHKYTSSLMKKSTDQHRSHYLNIETKK